MSPSPKVPTASGEAWVSPTAMATATVHHTGRGRRAHTRASPTGSTTPRGTTSCTRYRAGKGVSAAKSTTGPTMAPSTAAAETHRSRLGQGTHQPRRPTHTQAKGTPSARGRAQARLSISTA